MSMEQCFGIAQLPTHFTNDPSTSKHSLPRIDWGNPKVDEIVELVRKGEVSTRAAAKKLSILLQRKVSHTTMQRRASANTGDDKKSAKRKESPRGERELSDDSIRIIEPSVSSQTLNDRMDPFASKQWLEESNEYESYRITSSPAGGQSILEVWISPNLVRRYRACGQRDTLTHYRCATCDSLSFDISQPGRTITVQQGRVVGFLCPKHDVRCIPVEAPNTVISPNLGSSELGESNGRKRLYHSVGDTESEFSVPSDSPHYSLSPDIHEQGSSMGLGNHSTRRTRTLLDWDSGESKSVLLAVKNGEITLRQAAERLSAMVGKPIAHTTLHRRLKSFVLNHCESLETIDQNENENVVVDVEDNMVGVDEELSYANIRTLQNSQIVAALQEVAGGINSLRDELSGIRGALTDLKEVFIGFAQNNCNAGNQ